MLRSRRLEAARKRFNERQAEFNRLIEQENELVVDDAFLERHLEELLEFMEDMPAAAQLLVYVVKNEGFRVMQDSRETVRKICKNAEGKLTHYLVGGTKLGNDQNTHAIWLLILVMKIMESMPPRDTAEIVNECKTWIEVSRKALQVGGRLINGKKKLASSRLYTKAGDFMVYCLMNLDTFATKEEFDVPSYLVRFQEVFRNVVYMALTNVGRPSEKRTNSCMNLALACMKPFAEGNGLKDLLNMHDIVQNRRFTSFLFDIRATTLPQSIAVFFASEKIDVLVQENLASKGLKVDLNTLAIVQTTETRRSLRLCDGLCDEKKKLTSRTALWCLWFRLACPSLVELDAFVEKEETEVDGNFEGGEGIGKHAAKRARLMLEKGCTEEIAHVPKKKAKLQRGESVMETEMSTTILNAKKWLILHLYTGLPEFCIWSEIEGGEAELGAFLKTSFAFPSLVRNISNERVKIELLLYFRIFVLDFCRKHMTIQSEIVSEKLLCQLLRFAAFLAAFAEDGAGSPSMHSTVFHLWTFLLVCLDSRILEDTKSFDLLMAFLFSKRISRAFFEGFPSHRLWFCKLLLLPPSKGPTNKNSLILRCLQWCGKELILPEVECVERSEKFVAIVHEPTRLRLFMELIILDETVFGPLSNDLTELVKTRIREILPFGALLALSKDFQGIVSFEMLEKIDFISLDEFKNLRPLLEDLQTSSSRNLRDILSLLDKCNVPKEVKMTEMQNAFHRSVVSSAFFQECSKDMSLFPDLVERGVVPLTVKRNDAGHLQKPNPRMIALIKANFDSILANLAANDALIAAALAKPKGLGAVCAKDSFHRSMSSEIVFKLFDAWYLGTLNEEERAKLCFIKEKNRVRPILRYPHEGRGSIDVYNEEIEALRNKSNYKMSCTMMDVFLQWCILDGFWEVAKGRIRFFNCSFFTRMINGCGKNPNNVEKFISEAKRGTEPELIFMPICLREHWSLVVFFLDGQNSEGFHLESLEVHEHEPSISSMLRRFFRGISGQSAIKLNHWRHSLRQTNSVDCGFFVCYFVESILKSISENGMTKDALFMNLASSKRNDVGSMMRKRFVQIMDRLVSEQQKTAIGDDKTHQTQESDLLQETEEKVELFTKNPEAKDFENFVEAIFCSELKESSPIAAEFLFTKFTDAEVEARLTSGCRLTMPLLKVSESMNLVSTEAIIDLLKGVELTEFEVLPNVLNVLEVNPNMRERLAKKFSKSDETMEFPNKTREKLFPGLKDGKQKSNEVRKKECQGSAFQEQRLDGAALATHTTIDGMLPRTDHVIDCLRRTNTNEEKRQVMEEFWDIFKKTWNAIPQPSQEFEVKFQDSLNSSH